MSLQGRVTSFLSEAQYGFIAGEDGRDYFLHASDLANPSQIEQICDGTVVEFSPEPTPKGYRARTIKVLDSGKGLGYLVPESVVVSKSDRIPGWDVVEVSAWSVTGTSEHSIDSAEADLRSKAALFGANGIINRTYEKSQGSDGNRKYSVHHFSGTAVMVGKKTRGGNVSRQQLLGLNDRASLLKSKLNEQCAVAVARARKRRLVTWLIGGCTTIWSLSAGGAVWLMVCFVTLLVGWLAGLHSDPGAFLQPLKSSYGQSLEPAVDADRPRREPTIGPMP